MKSKTGSCSKILALFSAVFAGLFTTPVRASSGAPLAQQIDGFVQHEMAAGKIPGLSIAVVQSGEVVYSRGYGFADKERAVRATSETIYPIASLSKQFTASAIMVLVQEGKLKLDSSVIPLLSGLNPPSSWREITVRELLNQTSGIANFLRLVDITKAKETTPLSIVDLIRDRPLAFAPGTSFQYSNTNYFLLAQIAQTVSGEDIYTLLHNRIFHPLNMNDTGLYDCTIATPHRTTGYAQISNKLTTSFPSLPPPFSVGCGGIQTTVLDLAKWDDALRSDWPLSVISKTAMWTPTRFSQGYGFGWVIDTDNGHKLIWHNGSIPGATCWMGRFVDEKLTVIVLTNLVNADNIDAGVQRVSEIGEGIAGLYDPALSPLSLAAPTSAGSIDPKLLAICQKAVTDVYAGKAEQAMYTPGTAQALFPNVIDQTGQLLRSLGPIDSFEPISARTQNGMNVITCRLTLGSTSLIYTFFLTSDTDLIAGIVPQN